MFLLLMGLTSAALARYFMHLQTHGSYRARYESSEDSTGLDVMGASSLTYLVSQLGWLEQWRLASHLSFSPSTSVHVQLPHIRHSQGSQISYMEFGLSQSECLERGSRN